jgi:uncharacterized DUF497 family protein
VGENADCSWDDGKRERNILAHGYDFADLQEVFDGRFALVRQDTRCNYGELRFNMLTEFAGRVINVTFTARVGKRHFISARPASRKERKIYDVRKDSL